MPSHYEGTRRETRALDALIKLTRASDSVDAFIARGLQGEGLTHGQLGVLEALLHLGPLSQRALGEKLLRSGANTCTVVDNLERDGLVVRERDTADRRVVTVSLTKEGRRRIERFFPAHAARVAEAFAPLSADEQEQLARLCKKLGLGVAAVRNADDTP